MDAPRMKTWLRSALVVLFASLLPGAKAMENMCDTLVLTMGANYTACATAVFGDFNAICDCAKKFNSEVSEAGCADTLLGPEAQAVVNNVNAACGSDGNDVPLSDCPVVVSAAVSELGNCITEDAEETGGEEDACTCVSTFNESVARCTMDPNSKAKIDMTVSWAMSYCADADATRDHASMCAAVASSAAAGLKVCMSMAGANGNATSACQCLNEFNSTLGACKEESEAERKATMQQLNAQGVSNCKMDHCLPHENCCAAACCSLGTSCNTCPFGYRQDSACMPQGDTRCLKASEADLTEESCKVRVATIHNCSTEMTIAEMQLSSCLASASGELNSSTACECMEDFQRPASCKTVPANRFQWNRTLLGQNASMAARLCKMGKCAGQVKTLQGEVQQCIDTHKMEPNWETAVCEQCFTGFNESTSLCRDDPSSKETLGAVDVLYETWCTNDCLKMVSDAEAHMGTCMGAADGSIEKMCNCMADFNSTVESCDPAPANAVRAKWKELDVCSASAHVVQCVETVGLATTALATCLAQAPDDACTCVSSFNVTVQGCTIKEAEAQMKKAQAMIAPANCDGPEPGAPMHCATLLPPAMTGFTACVGTAGTDQNALCACVTRLFESVDECTAEPAVASTIADIKGMYPECIHMDQMPEVDGRWVLSDVVSPADFATEADSASAVRAAVLRLSGCAECSVDVTLTPGSTAVRRLQDAPAEEHDVTANWVLHIPPESPLEGGTLMRQLESTPLTDMTVAVNDELEAGGHSHVTVASSSIWQPTTSSTLATSTTTAAETETEESNSTLGFIIMSVIGLCIFAAVAAALAYFCCGRSNTESKRSIKKPRTRGLAAPSTPPVASAPQAGARIPVSAGLTAPPGVSVPLLQPLPTVSAPPAQYVVASSHVQGSVSPVPVYSAGNGARAHASVTPVPTVTRQMPTYTTAPAAPLVQTPPVTFSSTPLPVYAQIPPSI